MKKVLSAVVLGSMMALTLGTASVFAGESDQKGFISVYSQVSEEAVPNMAKVTLSVETSDKDITKATEANKQAANDSIQAVKKLLDTSKGENVKTTMFNVSPEYRYKDGTRIFVQYNARNSYEVTIKDVSKLGKIISAALSNGANVVSNLSYSLDTNEESCNRLIQQAAAQARTRANSAASALGTSITGVKNMDVQCTANEYYQPRYNMTLKSAGNAMAMDEAMTDSGMPTEGGTIKLRANVGGSFYVK